MQALSAVIITRNEARNIARCLESVRGVVDEVVVVDAESTDATRDIAQQLGARVHTRAWVDYSDQKNFANAQAAHPWILSLDADEALSPELTGSIIREKEEGLKGAYELNRLTNYAGSWVRHGGWYPDAKVRLFHREKARWTGEHVHETLSLDPETTITHLRGDLLHYSYPSVADHEQRIERYSDLHARKMLANGKRSSVAKLWLSPLVKFIDGYFVRLGLLDGSAGWDIARLSAKAVHLKYAKLNALIRGQAS